MSQKKILGEGRQIPAKPARNAPIVKATGGNLGEPSGFAGRIRTGGGSEEQAFLDALSQATLTNCEAVSVCFRGKPEVWWVENNGALFGYSAREKLRTLTPEFLLEQVHPGDRAAVDSGIFKFFQKKGRMHESEFRWMREDGACRLVASQTTIVVGAKRERIASVTVYRDVTDAIESRRQSERDNSYRRDVEIALRRESKMRATAERVVRKQSQALSSTLGLLLRKPEHPDFVWAILRAITRECGARWATYWQIAPSGGTGRRAIFFHGDSATEKLVEEFAAGHSREMGQLSRMYRALLEQHRCTIVLAADDRRVPKVIQAFYKRMEVRATLHAPLLAGRNLLGWISYLTKDSPKEIRPDKVAFVEAMGKQVALATQLKLLHETACAVEDARENERVARERAAEFSHVSELLRVPLATGGFGDIDTLVQGVLQNIVALLDGESASLWKWDDDGGSHAPIWGWVDGKAARLSLDETRAFGELSRVNHRALVKSWSAAKGIYVAKTSSPRNRRFLDEACPLGKTLRGLHLIVVPLSFNDDAPSFVLVTTSSTAWKSDKRRLAVEALALRAALALRLYGFSMVQRSVALAAERNRIARDLHDLLAQSFSGITLQIAAMRAECPDLPAVVMDRLEKVRVQAARSVDEVRRSIQMLRPALLDSRTLPDALVSLARETESVCGFPIKFSTNGIMPPLESKLEMHLFAIASEALQNAVRHAKPSSVTISLKRSREQLLLMIQDDGRGFERGAAREHWKKQCGLSNMRERAREIGGELSLRSKPGGGTRVRATVSLGI